MQCGIAVVLQYLARTSAMLLHHVVSATFKSWVSMPSVLYILSSRESERQRTYARYKLYRYDYFVVAVGQPPVAQCAGKSLFGVRSRRDGATFEFDNAPGASGPRVDVIAHNARGIPHVASRVSPQWPSHYSSTVTVRTTRSAENICCTLKRMWHGPLRYKAYG